MIVPVVFCADANFGTYLPVAVQSIIENSSAEHEYHIIIFDCGIKPEDLAVLERQIAHYAHFRLRAENITAFLDKNSKNFKERKRYPNAIFGRLFIPELCSGYDKVIYADIDMIFERDIAELMSVDLGKNYIAGVVDTAIAQNAQIQENDAVINSGLLIFNIPLWKKYNLADEVIQFLFGKKLKCPDQDAINVICRGNIYFLNPIWNTLAHPYEDIMNLLPVINQDNSYLVKMVNEYLKAYSRCDVVFHYNEGVKPWHSLNWPKAYIWWKAARQTVYYEKYIADALNNTAGINIAKETRFYYYLFGIPLIRGKIYPDSIKYYLLGMKRGRVAELRNLKGGGRAFYLFGFKLFSRQNK